MEQKETKTLEEIKKILKENQAVLREKFKVKEMGIFGSFVRGEQKKRSDVDILVEFKEVISLLKLVSFVGQVPCAPDKSTTPDYKSGAWNPKWAEVNTQPAL